MNYVDLIRRQAEQVFGNKEKAQAWLNSVKPAFGGRSPLQAARSESGYELIKAELERLGHGYAS